IFLTDTESRVFNKAAGISSIAETPNRHSGNSRSPESLIGPARNANEDRKMLGAVIPAIC
ncbi:MAG: hypothetical protein OXU71_03630, partial [Gammaproteobacteria bacterium]|nr:hypothetical protein [Gammaproteobacteria bacterium]